jgi:hypothetical protein
MGLITGLLTLPLAPLRGTLWAAEQILEQAEKEFYDPAKIRRQLDDVDRMRETGELTEDEATAIEDELVDRLLVSRSRPATPEG